MTGTTLNNESTTLGYANNYAPAATATNCTAGLNVGFDKVYAVTIPSGQRMTATATPVAPTASANPSLYLLSPIAACVAAPTSCVAGSDRKGAGVAESLVFINTMASATMFLVVDTSASLAPAMSYTLSVTLDTPPSSGDTCQAPNVLGTTPLVGQTTAGFTDQYFGPGTYCAAANDGPDRVYSLSIPTGQRATVTVTPDPSFDPSLSVAGSSSACNPPRACLESSELGGAGVAEASTVSNKTMSASTVYLIVDSAGAAGGFSIAATFGAIPPGDFCGNAGAPITASTTVSAQTTAGYTNDYRTGTACGRAAGPDRVHAVTVPPGYRLIATVHPLTAWDPSLSLVAGPATACEAASRTCIVNADFVGPGDDTLLYDNTTTLARTLFLVVDGVDPFQPGPYDLIVDLAAQPATPPGDTCATAEAVTPGTYAQTTVSYTNDYSPIPTGTNCTGFAEPGADHVYSISVPAGKTLTVTVAPTSIADPAIYFLASASACVPSPTACLGGNDSNGLGMIESASYTNSGTSVQSVLIVVDTDYIPFTYDLTISLP